MRPQILASTPQHRLQCHLHLPLLFADSVSRSFINLSKNKTEIRAARGDNKIWC